MPFEMSAKIEGFDGLLKQLREELPKNAATKALRQGVDDASRIILNTTQQLCPVASKDTVGVKPGLLKKSLGRKIKVKKGSAYAIIGPRTGMKDEESGMDPVHVGHLVEKGRKAVQVKEKKVLSNGETVFGTHVRAVAAKPFLRPALDQNQGAARSAIENAVRSAIIDAYQTGSFA